MRIWHREISFSTRRAREVLDVTEEIMDAFRESGIKDGVLVAHLPHATASLILNENESGLTDDILRKVDELVPVNGNYSHDRIDDNAHAHIKSAILGSSVVLPVVGGRIVRGTWQNFLVLEEDGPRSRRLVVFMMGE